MSCDACDLVALETGGVVTRCIAHERRVYRSAGPGSLSASAQRWIADNDNSR